jgi:hypothetical protein
VAAPPVPPAPPPPPPPALPAIETKGLVVIDSKPQGATIYLNDKRKGPFARTPWQGSLDPKAVRLLLESKGFKPEQRNISPRSDKLIDVYIALSEEHYLGWIEVISNVPGADVFIDRRDIGAIGRTPYTGHLKPGKHVVYLERRGYKPAQLQLDIVPGTATQHTIPMERADNGWISVVGNTSRGARLVIDDKRACDAPCEAVVTAGPHAVEVEMDGMETYESKLKIDRASEALINVQFSPRPGRGRAVAELIVAAGIAGGGYYAGLLARQTRDDINSDIAAGKTVDPSDRRYTREKIERYSSYGLYGVAGIVGLTAIYHFFAHGPDSVGAVDQHTVGLAPSIAPQGGVVSAFGSF